MDESIKMQLRESYSMQRIDDEFEEAGKRLAELEQAEKELGETQLLLIEEQERNQRLIQRLSEVERERDEMQKEIERNRDSFYERFLDFRGLAIDEACEDCGGAGVKVYGNTSTWRRGIGGQMMTSDICDKCWGSGSSDTPWVNLKKLIKENGSTKNE